MEGILIIIVEGYSVLIYLYFWLYFYCFVDSVVFFTSSKTSLHWFHILLAGYLQCKVKLMHCKFLLYCIWKGFEAVVMFRGYSDSFLFLLIDSLFIKLELAGKCRFNTNFLKSTVM